MLGVFDSVEDATNAISEIIGAGIMPAALEMMDQGILVAVEQAFHFGFPLDAQAILLIEVDGLEAGLDEQRDRIIELCQQVQRPRGAAGQRRQASGSCCGRPASRRSAPSAGSAPAIARKTASCRARSCRTSCGGSTRSATKHDMRIVNVFHAGDGNIHPILLFDERDAEQVQPRACGQRRDPRRVHRLRRQRDRRARHRRREDRLHAQNVHARRSGRDAGACTTLSNPTGRLSPDKMLPTAGGCGLEQKHRGGGRAVSARIGGTFHARHLGCFDRVGAWAVGGRGFR